MERTSAQVGRINSAASMDILVLNRYLVFSAGFDCCVLLCHKRATLPEGSIGGRRVLSASGPSRDRIIVTSSVFSLE